jgi:hypothetical protein
MRAYVIITGAIFVLLVGAHLWRITVESHLATDPFFMTTTLVAVLLTFWAARLVWRSRSR